MSGVKPMQVRQFAVPLVVGALALCVGSSAASDHAGSRVTATAQTAPPAVPSAVPAQPITITAAAHSAPAAVADVAPSASVPPAALAAYHRASSVINAAAPRCHLPWELLAAVGQVESDHGLEPPDQASGPLRLTAETWRSVAVDGDGDGIRARTDLDDATLGLAVLLCADGAVLTDDDGRRSALARHNSDTTWLTLVLKLTTAYGEQPTPTPDVAAAVEHVTPPTRVPLAPPVSTRARAGAPKMPLAGSAGTSFPAGIAAPTPPTSEVAADPEAEPTPEPEPTPEVEPTPEPEPTPEQPECIADQATPSVPVDVPEGRSPEIPPAEPQCPPTPEVTASGEPTEVDSGWSGDPPS